MERFMEQVEAFMGYLEREERSEATREQYRRDICSFLEWSGGRDTAKETVIRYKEELQDRYKPETVNTKLAALNSFFSFLGRGDLRVKQLKIQRQAYCPDEKALTKAEYQRLVDTAFDQGKQQMALILQTICATGIRVSELEFITAEAVEQGEAAVRLKGKNRTILIPGTLRRALRQYLKIQNIRTGPIFISRNGKALHRSVIWRMMKSLCQSAGVEEKKVYPHNLRHLFARCFYGMDKDIARLADILGHSSINTTRIYIISTGDEHKKQMDRLGLVKKCKKGVCRLI